jgi:hypothetical protein
MNFALDWLLETPAACSVEEQCRYARPLIASTFALEVRRVPGGQRRAYEMTKVAAANRQDSTVLRWVGFGAIVWGLVGLVIALGGLSDVNADAKMWVGVASILLPLCAGLAGAFILGHRHLSVAGGLLFLSIGTPTYFAWAVNLIPIVLIVGLAIAVRQHTRFNGARS